MLWMMAESFNWYKARSEKDMDEKYLRENDNGIGHGVYMSQAKED